MVSEKSLIKENVSLKEFTTFRIGGNAKYFYEPVSVEDMIRIIRLAEKENLPWFVLGRGSNILVSDKGFPGIVIKPASGKIVIKENAVEAEAGAPLAQLVASTVKRGLGGLEWAFGIPGTVGGSLYCNANAFGGSIAQTLKEVEVYSVTRNKLERYSAKELHFDYDSSPFKNTDIVIRGAFRLAKADNQHLKRKIQQIAYYRATHHPQGFSAGCIFKNIQDRQDIQNFLKNFPLGRDLYVKQWKSFIPAGYLIEKAGLKGYRIGGVRISAKHANFIINDNSGTAEDVAILISLVKEKVKQKFGLRLKEEIRYVGFS